MKEEILTDEVLRQFLLGKLDDEQRERLESLFLTDSQARERVLAVEQDLVEDYLENSLTIADREEFLSRYGQTSAQQRQLRINKSIKDWALRESSTKLSLWARLRERLALKPTFVIPIALTAMIALVFAVVWFSGRREQQNRHLEIEQELAQLNAPAALRDVPPHVTLLDLSPVTVRSVEHETELKKTADTQVVQLHLPWIRKERYSKYKAEVSRVGDDESFTVPDLQAEDDGGYRVRMRLPAPFLRRGHYNIRLSGLTPEGTPDLTEEYTFAVNE